MLLGTKALERSLVRARGKERKLRRLQHRREERSAEGFWKRLLKKKSSLQSKFAKIRRRATSWSNKRISWIDKLSWMQVEEIARGSSWCPTVVGKTASGADFRKTWWVKKGKRVTPIIFCLPQSEEPTEKMSESKSEVMALKCLEKGTTVH